MENFKLVVAGCGAMSDVWIQAATKLPGLSIVGLMDINPDAARRKAEKYALNVGTFSALSTAIQKTGANLVFDVTIPDAHESIAVQAMTLGCDVLGEKPLAGSVESARRIVETSRATGRTHAVMQNRRWIPQIVALRNFIRDGQLGELQELHADMFVGPHFGGFREEMMFPLLLDMSIHTFDEARFLSDADPLSVYCHSFNPKRSWFRHDASAVCIFEMSDGLVFTYRGSWCAEGLPADWNGEWRAIGSNGTAKWDGKASLQAQIRKPDGKPGFFAEMQDVQIPVVDSPGNGHLALIEDYLKCLRSGRSPQTICTDNIKSLAMVDGAVQSARHGLKASLVDMGA